MHGAERRVQMMMGPGRVFVSMLFVIFLLSAVAPLTSHAQQPPAKPQEEFLPITELPPQDQLPAAPLLVAAYAFVWLAIGGYILSVARRISTVQHEVERLETELKRGNRTR